jgi:hypothetical protein
VLHSGTFSGALSPWASLSVAAYARSLCATMYVECRTCGATAGQIYLGDLPSSIWRWAASLSSSQTVCFTQVGLQTRCAVTLIPWCTEIYLAALELAFGARACDLSYWCWDRLSDQVASLSVKEVAASASQMHSVLQRVLLLVSAAL